jgi:superfamily II DNA or RNA helicase
MERKDGKHIMFPDFFGPKVYKPPQSHTLNPTVKLIQTGITLKPGATWVEKVNDLCEDDSYQRFISAIAKIQVAEGHQVLVIADRVGFLQKVNEYVGETCVLVTGETDFEQRQKIKQQLLTKEKMCVAGSRQIFSEGISINSLSCVILAVPIANDSLLEQIIGRIQRENSDKLQPVVLDMQFAGYTDKRQNRERLGFYLRKGWDVETV